MHRIDTLGNVDGLFVPPNPMTGQPPVVVDSAWLNDIQENLMALLADADIAPVKGSYGQVDAAVLALIARAIAAMPAVVNSFEGRTGAVLLEGADLDAALALGADGIVQRTGPGAYNIISPTKLLQVGDPVIGFGPVRAGALLMDGSAFSAVTYPLLAAFLGGNVLPNMVDMFPGGAGDTFTLGQAHASSLASHYHETDILFSEGSGTIGVAADDPSSVGNAHARVHTDSLSGGEETVRTSSTGGAETYPKTMGVNWFMIHD